MKTLNKNRINLQKLNLNDLNEVKGGLLTELLIINGFLAFGCLAWFHTLPKEVRDNINDAKRNISLLKTTKENLEIIKKCVKKCENYAKYKDLPFLARPFKKMDIKICDFLEKYL